jgi:transcriptional regulator with XRE-family HTH domain
MKAPTLDETVRRRIAAWMTARDLSQTALAAAIDQNQPWVNRYLKGILKADLETLARIAAAFDQPITALLDAPPTKADAVWLEAYRALPPATQTLVRQLVLALGRLPR